MLYGRHVSGALPPFIKFHKFSYTNKFLCELLSERRVVSRIFFSFYARLFSGGGEVLKKLKNT